MFTTIIVRPIFNLLVLIYGIIPGHNFGLSIIIFTIVIRLLMWPLVKKQLHQAKAMRKLQPEIKKIKKAAAGNKQKESLMLMELYKEKEIKPLGSIGTLIIQFVILIGLYIGLRKVVYQPHQIVSFAYPSLRHLSWMKELAANKVKFNDTLFGWVNLSRSALTKGKSIYWAAMVLVLGSAVTQFFQGKQLMPSDPNSRKLKDILKDAGSGNKADQSEVNAAVGRGTRYLLPVMIFLFTVSYPSALSLYWLVGGLVAFIQQSRALREDVVEMDPDLKIGTKNPAKIQEAEIVTNPVVTLVDPTKPKTKKPKPKTKKRRKR
jgi:YidC/Oxa1 family membrane protein insertase